MDRKFTVDDLVYGNFDIETEKKIVKRVNAYEDIIKTFILIAQVPKRHNGVGICRGNALAILKDLNEGHDVLKKYGYSSNN